MTDTEKLTTVKSLLGISDNNEDALLNTYLSLAKSEILSALYAVCGGVPTSVTEIPPKYDVTQIMAVVNGYSQRGAEGEVAHDENGINRTYQFGNAMTDYIRHYVTPYVKVV